MMKKEISSLTQGGVYFMGSHNEDMLAQFDDEEYLQKSLKDNFSKAINEFQNTLLENLMNKKAVVPYSSIDLIIQKKEERS